MKDIRLEWEEYMLITWGMLREYQRITTHPLCHEKELENFSRNEGCIVATVAHVDPTRNAFDYESEGVT